MSFASLRIEGGLLSAELLDRLEALPGQRPADFGLPAHVSVKDEIARAWVQAQALWRGFQRRLAALPAGAAATRETRQHWVLPLLGLLGWRLEFQPQGVELDGRHFALSHRDAATGVVVHVLGWHEAAGLDRRPGKAGTASVNASRSLSGGRSARPAAGSATATPRLSAHALVQDYLHQSDTLYALVSNGRVLRLLRDSTRLAQLCCVEFDLECLFSEALFADFALLVRLLHVSRFPARSDAAAACWLERWHQDSLEADSRIRAGLARAVEQALLALANGFIRHPANGALQRVLEGGGTNQASEAATDADADVRADAYFGALLRLIYRLLFLLVVEERGLVFPAGAPAQGRALYECCYGLQRLRRLAERPPPGSERHGDLWPALLFTFSLFEAGGPGAALGLTPLAGGLFAQQALGDLAGCRLDNATLLAALCALGQYTPPEGGRPRRVNYAALNVEELGSVYEGLLDYRPALLWQGAEPAFELRRGQARARSGAHYTPQSLVQPLLQHALAPLLATCERAPDPCAALLTLRVVDVACGSGHLLLAAARRIAQALATARSGEAQPSPTAWRTALRDVIRHCIHGVDLNPLAVELCKVALWLEAHLPGEPLSFLDHHIKQGNAIVGTARLEDIARRSIPSEAFTAQAGDDKAVAAALRRRNQAGRAGQGSPCFNAPVERGLQSALRDWRAFETMPEHTPQDLKAKQDKFLELSQSPAVQALRQLADIPAAQFYLPKRSDTAHQLVTACEFDRCWRGDPVLPVAAFERASAVARKQSIFHWFLEFPEVLAQGGFDCVLANLPYLGGTFISGVHGREFCNYAAWEYAPTGLSEMVVFFMRRMYALLKSGGSLALVATNSIREGNIRRDGLEFLLSKGAQIAFAVRSVKWPGSANVRVSLLALRKGVALEKAILDGKPVSRINAFLEEGDSKVLLPKPLPENRKWMFEGSKWVGDGFLLNESQAADLLRRGPSCRRVLLPLLHGEEVNQSPAQRPGRHVIYMADEPLSEVRQYPAALEWLITHVKPYRDAHAEAPLREKWWQFKRPTVELYARLAGLSRCFVATATTKYLNFSAVPAAMVFAHTLKVLATDRWDIYAVLQSTLHEVWARKYSGTFAQELRYSSTQAFETFVLPGNLWRVPDAELAALGEHYHEHRRRLMLRLNVGLTGIYNFFHDPSLGAEKLAAARNLKMQAARAALEDLRVLRRLQVSLDIAVSHAYGWRDLDLNHGFVDVESRPEHDRLRFTLGDAARHEVLRRLLELNLSR
ncbi:type IIL restriction-modification enzyme MmeI [Azohydromonas lata]|uniref:site-specific DNA-methyltransferase (adenine-specific) n=1 Tax=Azohydromonas lata TaxID=45677 RepID=A0ABU5IJG0_9BURK|nr:type IIL restriction-modification enzyme MmeI [Azohydromonas lata]MDZ5459030.1 type IIL restriction-modification enzyme MmeI [Azohydromonas lata]